MLVAGLFCVFAGKVDPASASTCDVAAPNLVAYYPFDGNASEATGSGLDGTPFGGVAYASGICGQAAEFDGLDDSVSIPSTAVGPLDVFTLSLWMRVDTYTPGQSYAVVHDRQNGDATPNKHFDVRVGGVGIFSGWEASGGANAGLEDPLFSTKHGNDWVHVAMTRDANGDGAFWVDGALVDTTSGPIETGNSDDWLVGAIRTTASAGSEAFHFDGAIDELRVYARALTEAEILDLASQASDPPIVWSEDFVGETAVPTTPEIDTFDSGTLMEFDPNTPVLQFVNDRLRIDTLSNEGTWAAFPSDRRTIARSDILLRARHEFLAFTTPGDVLVGAAIVFDPGQSSTFALVRVVGAGGPAPSVQILTRNVAINPSQTDESPAVELDAASSTAILTGSAFDVELRVDRATWTAKTRVTVAGVAADSEPLALFGPEASLVHSFAGLAGDSGGPAEAIFDVRRIELAADVEGFEPFLNLDLGTAAGTAPDSYAAAGDAGRWNGLGLGLTPGLEDIDGIVTAASVDVFAVSTEGPIAGANAMLGDHFQHCSVSNWRVDVDGLADGPVRVLVYAPEGVSTGDFDVSGIPVVLLAGLAGDQLVEFANWRGVRGLVEGGLLTIEELPGGTCTGVAGIQVETPTPLPEPGVGFGVGLGLGWLAFVRGRRRSRRGAPSTHLQGTLRRNAAPVVALTIGFSLGVSAEALGATQPANRPISKIAPNAAQPTSALPSASISESIHAEIAGREYRPSWGRLGLQAPNRAHGIRTRFTKEGIRVERRTGAEEEPLFGLRLTSVGRENKRTPIGPGELNLETERVELRREKAGLTEWFVNSADGLEQGVDLAERPTGTGELSVRFEVEGAHVVARGSKLHFRTEAGRRFDYGKLYVEDATGRALPARFAPQERAFEITVDDRNATYPIVIDPLLTGSFDGEIDSNQINAGLGSAIDSAGDVNGDGYEDIIVGADFYDNGQTNEGVALIFHGGPDGIGTGNPVNADTLLEGNQSFGRFGGAVAGAGDVNGDGYDDVLVGAPSYETFGQPLSEGAAFLFLGGPGGIANGTPATADAVFNGAQGFSDFGAVMTGAGDLNGDGYADIAISARLYNVSNIFNSYPNTGRVFVFYGSASGIPSGAATTADVILQDLQDGARFGHVVAGAGDVDADGFDDLLVTARDYDIQSGPLVISDVGRLYVYYGDASGLPTTAATIVSGSEAGAQLGLSADGIGDADGDGYADISYLEKPVSDPFETIGRIRFGGPGGLDPNPPQGSAFFFGSSFGSEVVRGIGDVDGDGRADLVAMRGRGGVSPSFMVVRVSELRQSSLFAFTPLNWQDADTLHAAGADVDGDGFDDLLIAAPDASSPQTEEGQVRIYLGGGIGIGDPVDDFPGPSTSSYLKPSDNEAFAGADIQSAGDVNGDGFGDVMMSLPGFDSGETAEGAVFVYLGGPDGILDGSSGAVHAQLEGNQPFSGFGRSIASVGDMNGDGFDDILIGAGGYDTAMDDEGAAFLFYGSASGLQDGNPSTADHSFEGDLENLFVGERVASAGDLNGDGFPDALILAGSNPAGSPYVDDPLFVLYGSPTGPSATGPANVSTTIDPGRSITSPVGVGDINGDGFGDLAFGYPFGSPSFLGGSPGLAVLHGGPTGLPDGLLSAVDSFVTPFDPDAQLGRAVASAGDFNGDGFGDVFTSAPEAGLGISGEAYVFFGGPGGIGTGNITLADFVIESFEPDDGLGYTLSSAGDLNGDGFGDIAISSQSVEISPSVMDSGLLVFLGGDDLGLGTFSNNADFILNESNNAQLFYFIQPISAGGDLNGDGFPELLTVVSESFMGNELTNLGLIIPGNTNWPYDAEELPRTLLLRQLRGDGSGIRVGRGGNSLAADAFEVEMNVFSPRGRELGKLEVEACPASTPFGDAGCSIQASTSWTDLGTNGTQLNLQVTGLTSDTLYRWRARGLYAPLEILEPGITPPPMPKGGPWRRLDGRAGTDDIRISVPEPGFGLSLAIGLSSLRLLVRRRSHPRSPSTHAIRLETDQ